MVTIAVADGNKTYCLALKTMLEQVQAFRILLLDPERLGSGIMDIPGIDILLVDIDLYLLNRDQIMAAEKAFPQLYTIILTMDKNELDGLRDIPETIYKGSGKREFTSRIRSITTGGTDAINTQFDKP